MVKKWIDRARRVGRRLRGSSPQQRILKKYLGSRIKESQVDKEIRVFLKKKKLTAGNVLSTIEYFEGKMDRAFGIEDEKAIVRELSRVSELIRANKNLPRTVKDLLIMETVRRSGFVEKESIADLQRWIVLEMNMQTMRRVLERLRKG